MGWGPQPLHFSEGKVGTGCLGRHGGWIWTGLLCKLEAGPEAGVLEPQSHILSRNPPLFNT